MKEKNILWFDEIGYDNILQVGGKNASLGEMYGAFLKEGINIPEGFAITTKAYLDFMKVNGIDKELKALIKKYDLKKIEDLQEFGKKARERIRKGYFSKELEEDIINAYEKLKGDDVAVRSSAVCEDMPNASFAGQFETFLNVRGTKNLLSVVKKCIASTFNDRVIAYREEKKISHLKFALSVGVLKMIRSDLASSGIMFTLDTETGFKNVVLINSIFGIGEMIVKGKVTPDEFYVFKPTLEKGHDSIITKNLGRKHLKYEYSTKGGLKEKKVSIKDQLKFSLTEKEILTLARWAVIIENHYSKRAGKWMPQDIEWAKDGKTGELFIVQSRPETVHASKTASFYEEYQLNTKKKPFLTGIAVGEKIGIGKVKIVREISKMKDFEKGEVLVTKMTDPDWLPIMRIASAIVTNEGGKSCHAAIVARELGIPAIVGTHKATDILKDGEEITVDCTEGLNGRIFKGKISYKVKRQNLGSFPKIKTKIMVNIGAPEIAFRSSFLPNQGVGLAREEFIIAEKVRVHPLALYHYKQIKNPKSEIRKNIFLSNSEIQKIIKQIKEITVEHKDKKEFFIKELAEGIAKIGAAFYPKEVIVRFSDFKTNEYKNLIGGEIFENEESNPMLGFRGACRYIDKNFMPAFKMECQAIKRVRNVFGLKNVNVMVPFCRTVEEGKKVMEIIRKEGLNEDNFKVYMMCEIPSNIILADDFLSIFDGFSIGSNDLAQLTLGLDRDNGRISYIGDERNKAVKKIIGEVIKICKKRNKYIGICGEAPSTYSDFADFLVEEGIESISINPNMIIKTHLLVAKKEDKLKK
ncbi:MAG: phosphoenolpyruvate synthase [Candidatus Pacebacteria bacterium]|nr:phosphoenolpyruvate synthase [Candidatus Paceibacterota bacterium]MDD4201446.1 phosphoenolpyruvate synthase [Candidatus Paceibacterota bacterium]MDD4467212.1 phosphoenolpyruvate synthase [Candidatus Paceibacterota bacterium]MDD5445757.1 phosphoenolpyruvate synthase [Candidatus Paceibacterota bacterium]